ncbi:MAG: HPF/RaiA family ribosome-associated protein [Gammaproteobacteria bacterium]
MNIHLHTQGFDLTPAIEAHAKDQMRFHLAHFDECIVAADVYMKDINGPKGGPDKKVLIRLQLTSKTDVTIERTRSNLYTAIAVAARQSKRSVRRTLNKSRRMEKFALRQMGRISEA